MFIAHPRNKMLQYVLEADCRSLSSTRLRLEKVFNRSTRLKLTKQNNEQQSLRLRRDEPRCTNGNEVTFLYTGEPSGRSWNLVAEVSAVFALKRFKKSFNKRTNAVDWDSVETCDSVLRERIEQLSPDQKKFYNKPLRPLWLPSSPTNTFTWRPKSYCANFISFYFFIFFSLSKI
jgi:hypothetical protein